jgi:hypothetical protein
LAKSFGGGRTERAETDYTKIGEAQKVGNQIQKPSHFGTSKAGTAQSKTGRKQIFHK